MKLRLALTLLALASGASAAPASEQLPASVYARAEALIPQHIHKLIYGTSVRPQWIGETSRFWYEKRTPAGREYLLVDASARTTQPLFAHDDLIGKLAAAGKPVARAKFQLVGLKVDAKSGALRFSHDGKDWQYDPDARALTPHTVPADKGLESPDAASRAFVRDGNLFVVATKGGQERQLTTDGTPDAPYATPVINPRTMIAQGTTAPIVEPALSWSPDSRRIATFRLSLEGARRLALVQSTPPNGEQPKVFEYVYTLIGDPVVPRARGVIFDVDSGKRTDMKLAPEPVLYYLPPIFEWSADSKAVFERVTERGYKALQLHRVDAATGASTMLSADRSDTYIDYWSHYWSYDKKSDTVFWTADKTGFLQLYAIDARSGTRRQVTSGDWLVRNVAGIDQAAGQLLITGTGREAGRDPYLRHLYGVSRKGGAMKLLTPEPLDHDVSVAPDGSYFVDNMSLINVSTRSVLRRASDGHIVMELGRADASAYLAAGYSFPEPFETVAADGKTPLYGAFFKPADFDPAKRYPVIEEIYTGPQIMWMDASRVGVHGYSAGGYDVVRVLTQRPDFYKVGLTGSGVHDNRLDKAWWNEQWMGHEPGPLFDANSNITWAPKLTGKLFVAHGELDENVPLANSLRLVDALINANKDFELLILPNADHVIENVPYFHRRRWDFFTRELLNKTPAAGYRVQPFE